MTVSRQTAIIAANAVPRRGGQGMNLSQMVEGLHQAFDLSVYAESAPGSQTSAEISMVRIVRAP